MNLIHVRNLEKFHPGYKDRDLKWAKVYFAIVQGDPEFELIESEIDKWRFIAMICLELDGKKPLPDDDRYWTKKGFNVKKRPMSLTLKMLHKFLEVVTEDGKLCDIDKINIQKSNMEKSRVDAVTVSHAVDFETLWEQYPNKQGKAAALRHFRMTVRTDDDLQRISTALSNYLASGRVGKGYIQNGSRWFNDWEAWVNPTQSMMIWGHDDKRTVSSSTARAEYQNSDAEKQRLAGLAEKFGRDSGIGGTGS